MQGYSNGSQGLVLLLNQAIILARVRLCVCVCACVLYNIMILSTILMWTAIIIHYSMCHESSGPYKAHKTSSDHYLSGCVHLYHVGVTVVGWVLL